jgi:hypothetical protein
MTYSEGSKLVIKDHTLPYYVAASNAPVLGTFSARLERSANTLENNYILGMYVLYLGTYKIGSIEHVLLKLARNDVFVLMDADNVDQWAADASSIKVLQEYSSILAQNPGLVDDGDSSYLGALHLSLTVSV